MTQPRTPSKVYLVASSEERPVVRVEAGKRYDVTLTTVVDSDLQAVADEAEGESGIAARLCGGRGTCVAIVEVEAFDA